MQNFEAIKEVLKKESRLIQLPAQGKVVFVGDTHGDLEATETVLNLYLKPGYTLVFLGDYVDRGKYSRENIELLLKKKLEAPNQIFLLLGNHEGYPFVPFSGADFWYSLSKEEMIIFKEIFSLLPWVAVTPNGIMAVHALPPDLEEEDIEEIEPGKMHWYRMLWGEFVDRVGSYLGERWGRPIYGLTYFERALRQFKCKIIIRAHQTKLIPFMFEDRCLTLATSNTYEEYERIIAIADLENQNIKTAKDLEIISI